MKINAKMKKKIVKVNSEWIKFNKSCFFFLRIILSDSLSLLFKILNFK